MKPCDPMRWVVGLLLAMATGAMGQELKSPAVSVHYKPETGSEVRFSSVPLIRGTSVQLYKPDWKEGYYSSNNAHPRAKLSLDGQSIVIQHSSAKTDFTATETVRKVSDEAIEFILDGKLGSE